ncbi:ADL291Wp [Eremothecium gossypii ATCC 10895]|uniref:ADL291Wp n=1 Tax=Eremothecium gossypii (strain ATCC 10895 / CBS 109.51 / FGSC 9923 / NRRL Y-1056) TaxID=284811 RepID=Q75B63_EREGS|nr:ADL291Wp [Eremothecium gossypii ATCC 10895]AAS51629.2 ADL291Wp [Eremothecium gossypii ATCC 10895]AEY95925.1 FADL291Wp [Eremothecium gossypii FDAG1]
MDQAPEVIRVKRRRDEDSMQALLLEESRLNKKGKYVFKLARTVELQGSNEETPLLKLAASERNVYVLEQQKQTQKCLPEEISEMLEEYLRLETKATASEHKRPSKRRASQLPVAQLPSMEFVYDIYIRENLPEDEFVWDKNTVGYIRIVEDNGALVPEQDASADTQQLSDDEDSNEEDYYRNDYPEDEDDDRSILFGSDLEQEAPMANPLQSPVSEIAELITEAGSEDIYDPLFESLGAEPNLLSSLNSNNYVDLDVDALSSASDREDASNGRTFGTDNDDLHTDSSFERHNLFPGEEDDPMAIHRDKVLGKLQRILNGANGRV